jgi:hypothetical protein
MSPYVIVVGEHPVYFSHKITNICSANTFLLQPTIRGTQANTTKRILVETVNTSVEISSCILGKLRVFRNENYIYVTCRTKQFCYDRYCITVQTSTSE